MPISKDQLQIDRVEAPSITYSLQMIESARQGISRKAFFDFAKHIRHSVQSLASVMPASYSTLTKKKIYDQETSERILELVRLYAFGQDVFGSIDRFNDWLHSVCIPLGRQEPFDLLDTSFGIELVMQEIGRIDHGVFA